MSMQIPICDLQLLDVIYSARCDIGNRYIEYNQAIYIIPY
jgi:hypothetical protein